MSNKPSMDMPNLDLLRSFAVLAVLFAHLLLAFSVEWVGRLHVVAIAPFGVYMFFVHTSLVLMWSLQRRPNPLDFYIRRIFRLYPLAILGVLVVASLHLPVQWLENGVFYGPQPTLYNIVTNCLLVNGVLGHGELLLGPTWTLTPELLMYLLLPCLFFYARAVRKIWPLMAIWVVVVLVDKRAFSIADASSFAVLIPDFLAGVIAYVGFMKRRETVPSWLFMPFLLSLLGFFLMVHTAGIRSAWLVCLAIGLALPSFQQLRSKALRKATHAIAKYSYGIYLFHLMTIYLGFGVLRGHSVALKLLAVFVPLAVIVVAVYHWVEKPMIDLGARVAAKLAHERGLPSEKSLETLEPAP